ncbi:hypothetical protein OAG1_12040 [Agarivorans sp. OAG1]|nr:hypothetical protein OAG1_12040 [Agarivorans sp. OAG1]
MNKNLLFIGSTFLVFLFIAYGIAIVSYPQLFENLAVKNTSDFGGSFGVFASLFSGLALVCLVYTLYQQNEMISIQREELKLHREEVAKGVSSQIRSLHVKLMEMAMSDEELQQVWKPTKEVNNPSFKQLSYVNLILSNWEMLFKNGDISEAQLTLHIESKRNNEYFKSFWKNSSAHRLAVVDEDTTSKAARFHILVNQVLVN